MNTYWRLFLWFCAANLVTLLISIAIAHAIFEQGRDRPPDIAALVESAQSALNRGDTMPSPSSRKDRRKVFYLEDGKRMDSDRQIPRHIRPHLQELAETPDDIQLPRGAWLLSRNLQADGKSVQMVVFQGRQRRPEWMRWLPPALQILLSLIAIAFVGKIVSQHLTRPLQQIQATTRRMTAGDLSSRVPEELPRRQDEYGQLARDFDRMAQQIEKLVNTRDQLLHDVSHELRAPLARLRFTLELARNADEEQRTEKLRRADREISRMDYLVAELLALARLEQHSTDAQWPKIELRGLTAEVIDAERPLAEQAGVSIALYADGEIRAQCDQDAILRAVENVLRNAIKHSPAGSEVSVKLALDGNLIRLSVSDQGPGVAEALLAQLFEPFFRAPTNQLRQRSASDVGYGLGLAIVSRVMQAHGGRAFAHNCAGGGLRITLEWPVALSGADLRN